MGFGELLLLILVGVIFLKPTDLRQAASTAGRWMRQVRGLSQEFTREWGREADWIERETESVSPKETAASSTDEGA